MIDIVLLPGWFSNVEAMWDLRPLARFVERLATFGRVLVFDRRGTGLSDPAPTSGESFFEQSTDDLMAVLDAADAQRAALIGCDGGGPVALLAAGTHPQRVAALVLVNTFARMARSNDYPAGIPTATLDAWLAITAGLLVFSVFAQIAHVLNGQYTHIAGQVAVKRLLTGNLQLAYLGGVLVAGLIIPLALIVYAMQATGTNATMAAAIAGILVLVGNWLSKFTVIRAGTYAPLF
jgi:pimeloyl-ACP methyl ester carboxylesterase